MQNFYTAVRTIVEKSKGNKYILESLNSYLNKRPVLTTLMEEYSNLYNKVLIKSKKKIVL